MAINQHHVRENPWWRDRSELDNDLHLQQLEDKSLTFEHELPFQLDTDAVYTLRGPRQVGKTTCLKRLISRLLLERKINPRRVLYADVASAGLRDFQQLQEFVQQYVDNARHRDISTRLYLFLDEVTGIENWAKAIRTLHGRGTLQDATVIATGSHAIDLKKGGERAPGRRGDVNHWDWIMMSLCFRDYIELLAPELDEKLPRLENLWSPEHVYEVASEAQLWETKLNDLFQRYLKTGGYLYAVLQEYEHGQISDGKYHQFEDAIIGEIHRANLDENRLKELISWISRKRLGQEFSWSDGSQETKIGSKNTARNYLETAQALFLWDIYYRTLEPGERKIGTKSPKKLYPKDPFAWHVLDSWAASHRTYWPETQRRVNDPNMKGELVESVCADHFRRQYGDYAHYYRHPKGRSEIDFALFEGNGDVSLVEVKYRNRIRTSDRKALTKADGGILATQQRLDWHPDINVVDVPVHYLLAILPWELTLFPEKR